MKKSLISLIALVSISLMSITAMASPLVINGKWAGPAFANPAFDLDSDGNPARMFTVPAYDVTQSRFVQLEGVFDTHLVALAGQPGNTCPNPSVEFELEPIGTAILRGHQAGAVYLEADSSQHLCFNPAAPNEVLHMNVIGGTGIYAGRTGNLVATLNDTVLISVPPLGFPLFIDSRGSFTLTLN